MTLNSIEPVRRDKNDKLVVEYTLKEWLLKLHEEVMEFQHETLSACYLHEQPGKLKPPYIEHRELIAEEACDVITVLCGICQQFGISEEYLNKAMHDTAAKNRNRGYFDNGD